MSLILNLQKNSLNKLNKNVYSTNFIRFTNDGHIPSEHEKFHRPHKILEHSQNVVKPSISFSQKIILKILNNIFNINDILTYLPNKFMKKDEKFEKMKTIQRSININPTNPAGPWRSPSTVNSDLITTAFDGIYTVSDLWKHSIKIYENLEFLGEREIKKIYIHKNNEGIETQLIDFGDYHWKTYKEVDIEIKKIRKSFQNLGIKKGDKILFFAEARPEWIMCAFACINSGIQIVTAYPTLGFKALKLILNDINIKHIITSECSFETLDKLLSSNVSIKNLIYFKDRFRESKIFKNYPVSINERKCIPKNINKNTKKIIPYDKLLVIGEDEKKLSYVNITSNDLCAIMYTSGSTGIPKAAEISHSYIIANISGWSKIFDKNYTNKSYVSYLPLSHIFEFIVEIYQISLGNKLGYSSPLTLVSQGPKLKSGIIGDINIIEPNFITTVPMILNRIKKVINENLLNTSNFKQNLFTICYNRKAQRLSKGLSTPILDIFIFNNLSNILGGNLEMIIVGSAPLDQDVHRFIQITMNTNVLQGYGLTECVGATLTFPGDISLDNCGGLTPSCELMLREWPEYNYFPTNTRPQGEILLSGPAVIKNYFKNRNEDSFIEIDGKRWFCTGDIGEICENGAIKIIDRKKGIKKLNNGEFVSLAAIEGHLLTNKYVDQVCVIVNSKLDYFVAIIVANKKNVLELGHKLALKSNFEDLCKHKEIRTEILYNIKESMKGKILKHELPKKIILVTEPFTINNGLLTDAMKIKRNNIKKKYKNLLNIIYKPSIENGEILYTKVYNNNN
ncbi:AMP-dependent synthetase/ligase domain-containing protein [Strongyloides ratti]|uniref:long-chain-fatty-acid--CoA ligase n=1 Tax=Strongyloides ratti TaxID=34506 RepID=A0A090L6C4_STRRB|nr:AMP-dependent synthetase/ligase domain-containing protein [Strongyloides ratti]CEF65277.1 AMP-dependent synthetase/ligase domain-containing protein [Strongyloides ratti]